jgi:hypothetical protein
MPRKRSSFNRTIGVGLVTGGMALGAVGLLAPATASADIQVGGQNNSPGAAGGNIGGTSGSNNTFSFGRNNRTRVTQVNQNNVGGSGNTSVNVPINANPSPFSFPNMQIGGQNNSPGAAGGNIGGGELSNNTFVFGRNNRTRVTQINGNNVGGDDNTSYYIPITFP